MKNCIKNICRTDANNAIALIRIIIGLVFAMYGSQKIFGLFGGGLEGTAGYMASLGLEPSYLMALLAGSGNFSLARKIFTQDLNNIK